MSKKKALKNKLSFEVDDGEDEGEDGSVVELRKGSAARKFKKMRQAPGVAETVAESAAQPATTAPLGGAYSKESLANLRDQQRFTTAPEEIHDAGSALLEGMELTGEEAEALEELAERNALRTAKSDLGGDYVSLSTSSLDIEVILNARMNNKALLRGGDDMQRVYAKGLMEDKPVRAEMDLEQDNDESWEAEIIKRGVIHQSVLEERDVMGSRRAASARAGAEDVDNGSQRNGGYVSAADLIQLVESAVDRLGGSKEDAERRLQQLSVDLEKSQQQQVELRKSVESGVQRVNLVQDLRGFFASLVGMLREKTPILDEARAAVFKTVQEHATLVRHSRVEEQEDEIYRIKQAGLLVSIGNYVPSAMIAPDATEEKEDDLDEFGRSRGGSSGSAVAGRREQRRKEDRVRIAAQQLSVKISVGTALDHAEVELFRENRIHEIGATTGRGRGAKHAHDLFELLDTQRTLYSSKGVDGARADKLRALRSAFPAEYDAAEVDVSATELLAPLVMLDLLAVSTEAGPAEQEGETEQQDDWAAPSRGGLGSHKPAPAPLVSVGVARVSVLQRGWCTAMRQSTGAGGLLKRLAAQVLVPWCRDCVLPTLDSYSQQQCRHVCAIFKDIYHLLSGGAGGTGGAGGADLRGLRSTAEGLVGAQVQAICLPLLKGTAFEVVDAGAEAGAGAATAMRAFSVKQQHRMHRTLLNLRVLLEGHVLCGSFTAQLAWRALQQCAPSSATLLSGSPTEQRYALDVCRAVVAVMEAAQRQEPRAPPVQLRQLT
eukprot:CAMPEP_0173375040 /NCGR_PEP_ID=MMETSP1144-20121109/29415_1 /TAXON_ID=483371 /ORGANISM="non described non described, Strain CCMP2298" /LENGTH=773 /DNA_ID=CAMNT_0014327447 /DNA_START=44 /DNA_END=2362 /DNA_ORIENTATION=+